MGYRQAARHWVLTPEFVGSNPISPARADFLSTRKWARKINLDNIHGSFRAYYRREG